MPDDLGTAAQPIRLTSDPSWGQGEAELVGSQRVTGWQRGGHADMPSPEQVWFVDLDWLPRAVWLVDAGATTRIPLARTPNWTITSWDDVHSEWAVWEKVEQRKGENLARDAKHLSRYTREQLAGATVWSEYSGAMGTPFPSEVVLPDDAPDAVQFPRWIPNASRWSHPGNRYFLEDRPAFLDDPLGEFWFERKGWPQEHRYSSGRLYLRLPAGKNPNDVRVEVARHHSILRATELRHVHVSGLSFRFTNLAWKIDWIAWQNADVDSAAIDLRGDGEGFVIRHCRFEHVNRAVRAQPANDSGPGIADITLADCEIRDTDHGVAQFADSSRWGKKLPPYSPLGRVAILRNKIERVGLRPSRQQHGHALELRFPETSEIAGNVLHRTYGAGIFLFGGAADGQFRDAPLSRHLIHHNRVEDSMLGTNDWGGIEVWQAGPFYIFNNVSINPGGYYHALFQERLKKGGPGNFNDPRWGFAYCADGGSKGYFFNNIAVSRSNDPKRPLAATAAFHEVAPQQNQFFNNTAHNFLVGYAGPVRRTANGLHLSNLWHDTSIAGWLFTWPGNAGEAINDEQFTRVSRGAHLREELILADNLVSGPPRGVGSVPGVGTVLTSMEAFRSALDRSKVVLSQTGEVVPSGVLPAAAQGDYRPAPGSSAVGRGARVFVPWSLRAVVGEWHFRPRRDDPTILTDDRWYQTYGYMDRHHYGEFPRHHLRGEGLAAADFVNGPLEDWIPGALRLDGSRRLVLHDADLARPGSAQLGKETLPLTREHWRTPDIGKGDALIELVFRPAATAAAHLVGKSSAGTGYVLELDASGRPRLALLAGGATLAAFTADQPVEPGRWLHLVAEIDRARPDGLTLWLDGRRVAGKREGAVTAADLDNPGDFFVGGAPERPGFKGELEFLRLSLGTFASARTTIEELRAWQFDGPHLRDFTGRAPAPGQRRCAGALEP